MNILPTRIRNEDVIFPTEIEQQRFTTELSLDTYDLKGTDIMNCMLLSQYQNSSILKQYIGAFIGEMDILFTEVQKVELGRHLDNAQGAQLDVIGDILQQTRRIIVNKEYFGFLNVAGARSFGQFDVFGEVDQSIGGYFKSLEDNLYLVAPLRDTAYSKLLKARAYCVGASNRAVTTDFNRLPQTMSLDDIYKVINLVVYGTSDNYTSSDLIIDVHEVPDINGNLVDTGIYLNPNHLSLEEATALVSMIGWFEHLTHKVTLNIT